MRIHKLSDMMFLIRGPIIDVIYNTRYIVPCQTHYPIYMTMAQITTKIYHTAHIATYTVGYL